MKGPQQAQGHADLFQRRRRPSICLTRREVEEEDLPAVCMCCGAPATVRKQKEFSWRPFWSSVGMMLRLLIRRRPMHDSARAMAVPTSFCPRHKYYWLRLGLLVGGSMVGFVFLPFGGLILLSSMHDQLGWNVVDLSERLLWPSFALLIAWIVLAAIVQHRSIRATEITDYTITLTGVCRDYVQAVLKHRHCRLS